MLDKGATDDQWDTWQAKTNAKWDRYNDRVKLYKKQGRIKSPRSRSHSSDDYPEPTNLVSFEEKIDKLIEKAIKEDEEMIDTRMDMVDEE